MSVAFNGIPASNPSVNAQGTRITVSVPPLATTGPIGVVTPGGGTESSEPFTVTFGAALSPKAVWAGQKIRISGSAYPPGAEVAFAIVGVGSLEGTAADVNGNFSVLRTIPQIPPQKAYSLQV